MAYFKDISAWTVPKSGDLSQNEDQFFVNDDVLVLADGATDKSGVRYPSGKTGGRELAELAVGVAAQSTKAGYELASDITARVQELYRGNNPDALINPGKRATTMLAVARIALDDLVITQIGDANIRLTMVDGAQHILTNDKLIDAENAEMRSRYIRAQLALLDRQPTTEELEDIVSRGRGVIQARLNTQYMVQNNADDKVYGYGTIDGQSIPEWFSDGTPTEFVKTLTVPADEVARIELVSDGFYGEFPGEQSRGAYSQLFDEIHAEDPHKYLKYLSTKSCDDATVVIATLEK